MSIPSADSDAWATAEGKFQGKPSLLRFRPNLKDHLGNADYPRRITITWEFDADNSSGMPSNSQSDDMRYFEDAIVAALDPERLAILAFIFTNAGSREWHFYVGEISEVEDRINHALSSFPKLPISLQVEDDPDWNELGQVIAKCK